MSEEKATACVRFGRAGDLADKIGRYAKRNRLTFPAAIRLLAWKGLEAEDLRVPGAVEGGTADTSRANETIR